MKTKRAETDVLEEAIVEPNPGTATIDLVPQILHLKRILVPIDFSATSLKALRYAVAFAKQFDASLLLLSVVQPAVPIPDVLLPDNLEQDALDASRDELDEIATRLVPAGVNWQAFVRAGFADDGIVDLARETRTDLIILTTHGRTGLKHVLLGSTAEKVVRTAPCPVLVVRDREQEFA